MACIEARGLCQTFGRTIALDGIDLRVEEGRILGIYLAPLVVAAVVLFATSLSTIGLPKRMRALQLDPAKRHTAGSPRKSTPR